MDLQIIIMLVGFMFAAYSVVGNDVIQTLGTFLVSNQKKHWLILWGYAATILTITLVTGYLLNNGDVSYGRLAMIPLPSKLEWWYILPPVVLLFITYFGYPVSTTFIILSVFSTGGIVEKMIMKSVMGYAIAFVYGLVAYLLIARKFESKTAIDKMEVKKHHNWWIVGQWLSTGFLWSQWLIQDFANIYVYLPRNLNLTYLLFSLVIILTLLALVFKNKGGRIQNVVTQKTNTANIRSATLIDLNYGIVLFFFTTINPIPMSTTWVFVGILAGREYAINYLLHKHLIRKTYKKIFVDLYKVNVGLVVSIIVALIIRSLR